MERPTEPADLTPLQQFKKEYFRDIISDRTYILVDKQVVKPKTYDEFMEWFKLPPEETRRIAKTDIGNIQVSTVFLIHDHAWIGATAPVVFETMVFGQDDDDIDNYCERYMTYEEAEKGHASIVARIQAGEVLKEKK